MNQRVRHGVLVALSVEVVVLIVTGVALYFDYRPHSPFATADASVRLSLVLRFTHRAVSALMLGTAIVGAVLAIASRARAALHGAVIAAVLAGSFTAFFLPWEQLTLRAVTVGTNMSGYRPLFDDQVRFAIVRGAEVSVSEVKWWLLAHAVAGIVLAVLIAISWRSMRRWFVPTAIALCLLVASCSSDSGDKRATSTTTRAPQSTSTTSAAASALGKWRPLPPAPVAGRIAAGSVWTGDEVIVFGGVARSGEIAPLADGAAYRPATRTWRKLARPPDGVLGTVESAAAWTGTYALFWAGNSPDGPAGGALYDPKADAWRRLPDGPLGPRESYASVWTGTELLVIAGAQGDGFATPTAAAVNPSTGAWRVLHGFDRFRGLLTSGAVWTGHDVITAGSLYLCPEHGSSCSRTRPALLAYDPATDTSRELSISSALLTSGDKESLTPIASADGRVLFRTAGTRPRLFLYDPAAQKWTKAREGPCAVPDAFFSTTKWAGNRYVAGCRADGLQVYNPATDTWQELAAGRSPLTTRSNPVVVWTGTRLIAWSGATSTPDTPTPADGVELTLP